MDKPEQPPEGALIAEHLHDMRISIREAARTSGYSEGRLRQLINGYASAGGGQYNKVVAPAEALAKIGWAVGIDSADLQRVGRRDAADLLDERFIQWEKAQRRPSGDLERVDVPAIQAWASDPLDGDPPESILELFTDEDLLGEVDSRMSRYRADVTDYVDYVKQLKAKIADQEEKVGGDDGPQASTQKNELDDRRTKKAEVSDADDRLAPAADAVIPDDDEEPGGSR